MIIFDLKCRQDHAFEGWFENHEDLEGQIEHGLVSCPVCGDRQVRRVPSSFGIAKRRGEGGGEVAMAKMFAQAVQRHLREDFEDVGPRFAAEALKIHYGAAEARNIRGVSTPQEEKMLKDEGVSFFKVGEPAEAPARTPEGDDDEN